MFYAPQRIERMSTPCKRCGRAARKSAKGTCALCRTPFCTACEDGFRRVAGGDCCPGCSELTDQLSYETHVYVARYGGFARTVWATVLRGELKRIGLLTESGRKTRAGLDILLGVKLAQIGRAA